VHELRSGGSNSIDLDQAISGFGKELLEGLATEGGPRLQVQVEGTPQLLNPVVRDEVYRIGVEALQNAVRHARARHIEVEIRYGLHRLRLRIRDDGKGIDPGILEQNHALGRSGLRGMRERAKLVGGTFEVWSRFGTGTEIELNIPAATAYAKLPRPRWSILRRLWRS
jgi:signal transduction histidine kinase